MSENSKGVTLHDGWRLTHVPNGSWLWLYKELPNGWIPGVFDVGSHRPTRYRVFASHLDQMVNCEQIFDTFEIAKSEAIKFALEQPVKSKV